MGHGLARVMRIPFDVGVVICLLGACAAPAPPASGGASSDSASSESATPSAWSYVTEPDDTTPMEPTAFGDALREALARIPSLDPLDLMVLYGDRLRLATGGCPTFEPASAQTSWRGDCVSDHGAHFDGWGVSTWGRGVVDPEGGTCADDAFLFAFARITDALGVELTTFGTGTYQDCVRTDGVHRWTGQLIGNFGFPSGTWLDTLQAVELDVTAEDAAGVHVMVVEGGISALAGPLASVWLDALRFDAEGACTMEPTGEVRAWDDEGVPYVLSFEGAAACDGCGVVQGLVDPAATLCVDWSPYYTWEERPWSP